MDLSDLTPKNDTVVTKLTYPANMELEGKKVKAGDPVEHDGIEFWIERYLPHTREYKKSQYQRTHKYMKAAQKAGNKDVDIDLFEAEADRVEVLAETTVAWEIYFGGEWIKLDPEKAKEIYTKAFWIVKQLEEDENSAEVFTKA